MNDKDKENLFELAGACLFFGFIIFCIVWFN